VPVRKSRPLTRALAALAVVLGAGLIAAAPARADGTSASILKCQPLGAVILNPRG
jgi:hypothetical protein